MQTKAYVALEYFYKSMVGRPYIHEYQTRDKTLHIKLYFKKIYFMKYGCKTVKIDALMSKQVCQS